jgi:hypothetical protein
MMGCAIYYKKCQEVDTVTSQILIGIPNMIEEEIIKQMLDEELKNIEQILLKNNKEYKLTREQSNNWIPATTRSSLRAASELPESESFQRAFSS